MKVSVSMGMGRFKSSQARKWMRAVVLCWAAACLCVGTLCAQPDATPSFDARDLPGLLLHELAAVGDFTAEFEVSRRDEGTRGPPTTLRRGFCIVVDGVMRFAMVPPRGSDEDGKRRGQAEPYLLFVPGVTNAYVVLEAIDGYAEAPVGSWEGLRVVKSELGREKWNRKVAVKFRCTVTASDGSSREALLWTVPELENFPVRLELGNGDARVFTFKNPKAVKGASGGELRLPRGLKQYPSVDALMTESLLRLGKVKRRGPAGVVSPSVSVPDGIPPER